MLGEWMEGIKDGRKENRKEGRGRDGGKEGTVLGDWMLCLSLVH